jgi:hypothetical protein
MVEAAKPETPAPIMIASNSIMPLPTAEVDYRLSVVKIEDSDNPHIVILG